MIGLPWFVVRDDLIGGWAIATSNAPASEIGDGGVVAVDVYSRAIADQIVELHNAQLPEST